MRAISLLCLAFVLACRPFDGGPGPHVAAYVRAVAGGNPDAALAAWPPFDRPASPERVTSLAARREAVTRELLDARIRPAFTIRSIEWWSTCCDPGVIDDSREAGGARILVDLQREDGTTLSYVFDVSHRETTYWGSAAGSPPRDWVIRDAYPRDHAPIFWRR